MAKVVRDDNNRFRKTWQLAREQGVGRQVMADSLGIDRGRLNDLILGRKRPTMGEAAALTGRRTATLVSYRDERGEEHSFFTGRGMSYESLIEHDVLMTMAEEQLEVNQYAGWDMWTGLVNRAPKKPQTRIYSTRKSFTGTTRDMRVPKG